MTPESIAAQSQRLRSIIDDVDLIVLTTADLDGDSVGALVSMWDLLRQAYPSMTIRVCIESVLPSRYQFLVPAECGFEVVGAEEDWSRACAIVVDSEPKRFKCLESIFWAAKYQGIIDHHQKVDLTAYHLALYDGCAPSTTTLIYALYEDLGVTPTLGAAIALYAGLVFDTSVFRYKLTSPFSLRMAAALTELGVDHTHIVERLLLVQPVERVRLRALILSNFRLNFEGKLCISTLSETEAGNVDSGGLVDDLIFIEGVEVAALFQELPAGRVRISLRSRSDLNVAEVAQIIHATGGGHRRAAGVTVSCTLVDAVRSLEKLIAQRL